MHDPDRDMGPRGGGPGHGPAGPRPGVPGRRRRRSGSEPVTARSALGLRLLLSAAYIPVFVAGVVFFARWAADTAPGDSPSAGLLRTLAWFCAVLAVLALLDLFVVLRRRRQRRAGSGR